MVVNNIMEDVFAVGHNNCGISNLDMINIANKIMDMGIKKETLLTGF